MAYNLPGYQFPMTNIIPPHILERGRNNRVLGLGWDSDDDFDDFGPRGTLQSSQLVAPSPSTSSSIFPTSHPNNALTYFSNSPVTGGSSQSPPLYYHTDRHTKHRNQQRFSESRFGSGGSYSRSLTSDTATAHAIKTARYPVLYEKLKAPAAAKKALKTWKKEAKLLAVDEDASGAPRLEHQDQRLLQDAPRAAEGNAVAAARDNTTALDGTEGIELQDMSVASRPQDAPAGDASSSGSSGSPDGGTLAPRPSAAASTAVVVHGTQHADRLLPPQHMSFSEPVTEKTKHGTRLCITCTLDKSYPNFHIECAYNFLDKTERVNSSQTDTRFSFATISTRENVWVVAMEQKGYNEAFIKGLIGEAEYSRLDGEVVEPIRGHTKSSSVAAPVAKKIRIPAGFDLGGIWCKAAGFYQIKIFVPGRDYQEKTKW